MKMRVMMLFSMGAFLLSATQANAGLLDLFRHDDGCYKPKVKKCCKPVVKKCCRSQSNCCDSGSGLLDVFNVFDRVGHSSNCRKPARKCCKPKPVCCKPKPVCCKPKPVCCKPKPVCCKPKPKCSGSGKVAPAAPYEETPAPPEDKAPTPKKAA